MVLLKPHGDKIVIAQQEACGGSMVFGAIFGVLWGSLEV